VKNLDERPDYVITIEPDYDTDYGEWNGGVYCPEKEYAHGFKQKTDSWCSGGGECTGLNGIEFMCAISGQDNYVSTVREYEGPFGEWHNERLCAPKGFMKEGQQNYQSYQGIFTDDAGTCGVSFICDDGTNLDAAGDTHWVPNNVWTSFVICPDDSVICGFETKGSTAFPDNVEINRVRFHCCNIIELNE